MKKRKRRVYVDRTEKEEVRNIISSKPNGGRLRSIHPFKFVSYKEGKEMTLLPSSFKL